MSVSDQRPRTGDLLARVRRHPPPVRRSSGSDRHSRRVALLKLLLPALGLSLLLLVAAWPRLKAVFESVRITIPTIDLREARELKMVDPRYAGVDRQDRPYVLNAAIGRQIPNRKELVALDQPRARMTLHRAVVTITADSGVFQSHVQRLDLFGKVTLSRTDGTRFRTRRAHLDFTRNTAEGHDPIVGGGPSGRITAQGFRILAKGATVIFTGRSRLVLEGAPPKSAASPPPALPREVARDAVQIATAAAHSSRYPAKSTATGAPHAH